MRKQIKFKVLIQILLIYLIVGHLFLNEFFSPTLGVIIGIPIIIFINIKYFLKSKDYFGYLLIIFGCSHFTFGNNHGGIYNLIVVINLFLTIFINNDLLGFRKTSIKYKKEFIIFTLFIGISIINLLLINDYTPIEIKIKSILPLISYFVLYYISIKVAKTSYDFYRFFQLTLILNIYIFIVALFQSIGFGTKSPILPTISASGNILTGRIPSIFGDFELFAEYSSCIFIFWFILLIKNTYKIFNIPRNSIYILLVINLLNIFISGTRSSFILVLIAIIIVLFFLTNIKLFKRIAYISILLSGWFIFSYTNMNKVTMVNRIKEKEGLSKFSLDNLLNGSAINREITFQPAFERINSQNWILGHGWIIYDGESYYKKLFFNKIDYPVSDYHSLYLTLPVTMGWIGAIIFISLFYLSFSRNFKNLNSRKNESLKNTSIAFTFLIAFFLLNEYKIQFIRSSSYQAVIWVLIGLSSGSIYPNNFNSTKINY